MSFRVRRAFAEGIPRAFRRNGLVLLAVYLAVALLQGGLVWMVVTTALPLGGLAGPVPAGSAPNPGTRLPPLISLGTVPIALFTGGVLTMPIQVIANRVFVSRFTDRVPEEFVFRRLGRASINAFVGSVLVSVVVLALTVALFWAGGWGFFNLIDRATLAYLVGTWPGRALLVGGALALLIPVVFVGVSLVFVGQEVAVRDRNVLEAIAGSWRLARHNRVRLLALVLAPQIVQGVVSVAIFTLSPSLVTQIVSLFESSILHIIIMAVMARAYVEVRADGPTPVAVGDGGG